MVVLYREVLPLTGQAAPTLADEGAQPVTRKAVNNYFFITVT